MAVTGMGTVLDHLRRLVGGPALGDALDRELLARFARDKDEAAFAALVRRHGPMVHGVCRRTLGDVHAADDVYQATFLVLVRKAATLDGRGSLAGWLHTVAARLALKVKHRVAKQKARERQALPAQASMDDLQWRELRGILDEELNRLPAKLRLPLVLCYLQGLTRDEAAQQMEWSLATLKRRLEEGRERLRVRLERRGLGLSAALLATALSENSASAASAELLIPTVRAALAFAADEAHQTPAIDLAQGALQAMNTTKLKTAFALFLLLGVLGGGTGWLLRPVAAESREGVETPAVVKAEAPPVPVHKGLALHEWGVWRIHDDLEMANADMREVWEGLPKFVYGQVSSRQLPQHWDKREADKPVIFFHATEPVEVKVRVDFPGGLPAVWWPGTEYPGEIPGQLGPREKQERPFRHLEWRLRVKAAPDAARAEGMPAVDDGHWVKTLRAVKADDVFSHVGERGFSYQRERFLYYDALLPLGKYAVIAFDKDKITVANPSKFALADVAVVDRGPDRIRVARIDKMVAGAGAQLLTFKEEKLEDWPAKGVRTLTEQLTTAGLNADEAGSLVELWKKDLFETEGVTLFYRMPQEEYDRKLPLKVTPRPEKIVRVGLAVHPHCEPDLATRVEALVRDLDDGAFAKRAKATDRLEQLGRAVYGPLARIRKQGYYGADQKAVGLDLRTRLDALLKKYDAQNAVQR